MWHYVYGVKEVASNIAAPQTPAYHNNRIPYAVKNLSLTHLRMGKRLPETC